MRIIRSPRFDRAYRKLPEQVQKMFQTKIRLFVDSHSAHPSLRVKKIKGTLHIWEASIDMDHRFTFEKVEGGIRLRVIGHHKIIEKP